MIGVVILAPLFFLFAGVTSPQLEAVRAPVDSCDHYAPQTVVLMGKLTEVWKYGPPNYGENPRTDARVKVPILKLKRPRSVCGDPRSDINTDSERNIREVQLVVEHLNPRLVGKSIVATGTLFHSHTGHHYTKVLMIVKTIQAKR